MVTIGFGAKDGFRGPIAVADFEVLAASTPGLVDLAGYQTFPAHVAAEGAAPRRVDAEVVSGHYFDVLGMSLAAGRSFTSAEGTDASLPPVAVISDRIWQRDFAAAHDVIGRALIVNRQPVTIVGVAARGFRGASLSGSSDVWMPVAQHRIIAPTYPASLMTSRRIGLFFGLVGRLAPGASITTVAAQTESVRAQLSAANPADSRMNKWRFDVTAGVESHPWQRARLSESIAFLTGIAALLLVLTAANVGNLMVARAIARRGEIATRLALGASRFAVARLLLTESLLLSVSACAAAVALAWAVAGALEGTVVLQGLAPLDRAEMDWRVLGYAMLISTGVAIVAGVFPALSSARVDVNAALREAGRSQTANRQRLRRVLTVAQVAVSLTLLVGTALLVRSMVARLVINPGFDASKVLTFSVQPGLQGYGERPTPFYRDLLDRVRQVPGVRAAAVAWLRPSFQGVGSDTDFHAEGAPSTSELASDLNFVSPDFFSAVGLPLIDGREFSAAEFRSRAGEGDVVIMTESLAQRTFGGAPAVGRRIVMSGDKGPAMTVVGVVRDTKQRRLTATSSDMLFEPFHEDSKFGWGSVIVGIAAPQEAVLPRLRQTMAALDPTLPMYDVMRVDEAIRGEFADDYLVMRLTMAFAMLATLVAAVGLYGVLARGVSERRREFGIRVALGASPSAVAGLVTREALYVLIGGVGLGVGASLWLARYLDSRLFGITHLDAVSFAAAIGIIVIVMLASAAPAGRRAARVNAAEVIK
jgi:predicted permease